MALQQIKERAARFTYDWSRWYPSGNRPLQQYQAHRRGAGYGQFEHKADSLIAKFKEAGGTVREIDVWAESPRLSPLWLSASSSACHGLLIITVITPLPTKPSATKMPENWSWRTRQNYWYGDASAWCCRARCKIHEGAKLMLKLKNDALRDDVAAGRRRLHIKAVCQSVREATHNIRCSLPPTGRHRWTGLFTLRERLITMQNNWKEPRSILMSSVDRVAHIDGQLMQLLWAIHTRFQRSIKCSVRKPSNPFTNVCWFLF